MVNFALLGRLGSLAVRGASLNVAKRPAIPMINEINSRNRVNPANPGIPYPRAGIEETDEEFDARWLKYFSRPDIDGWELRKGINDMQGYDLIPEPKIMIAVLHACRRVNDHSLAVRYLEAVSVKANYNKKIMDYLMQEIRPTLNELGVSVPEELGYHVPELAVGDPDRSSLIESSTK